MAEDGAAVRLEDILSSSMSLVEERETSTCNAGPGWPGVQAFLSFRTENAKPKTFPRSKIQVLFNADEGEKRTPALVSLAAGFAGPGIKIFRADLEILPAAQE